MCRLGKLGRVSPRRGRVRQSCNLVRLSPPAPLVPLAPLALGGRGGGGG